MKADEMKFVTTSDETGQGRIIINGRYYGLPVSAVERIKTMYEVLDRMTAYESCDCGCPWKSKPVLYKPLHYYMAAKDALGRINESQEEVNENETDA